MYVWFLYTFYPGIYGVGKAAVNKPALVVLKHKPPGATKNIALCGKGIVYDTGGLSIKGKVQADLYHYKYYSVFGK